MKNVQLSADQSNHSKRVPEAKIGTSETKTEQQSNQSQMNITFQNNKNSVNKVNQSEKNTSGQSDISASESSCLLKQHSNTIQKKKMSK